MAMSQSQIQAYLKDAFPDALIEIEDLRGDNDHFSATVTSAVFQGKTRIEQHQMVYAALQGHMGTTLHALSLKTHVPKEYTMSQIFDQIRSEISFNDVVLYMKGNEQFPMCGFSTAVVKILKTLGVDFKAIDVLQDVELREAIKTFTNWPTLPQLYIKGEFVGGCDIVRDMYKAGELQTLLTEKGVPFGIAENH